MNGKLEPYMKHVEVVDKDNFAIFLYSDQTIEAIKTKEYNHIFIDGTKSCLPYNQRYQLLMINFYLEN